MSKSVHECMNSFVPGVLLKTLHASKEAGACLSMLHDTGNPAPSQQGEGLSHLSADESDDEAEEEIVARALSSDSGPATQPQQPRQ